jgi:uncharacterized protein (DUF1697 family)
MQHFIKYYMNSLFCVIRKFTVFAVKYNLFKEKEMTRYIALLRGVNVGGKNIIKMAELKAAFERHGFKNVVTYINSGNVLFDSESTDEAALKDICEKLIKDSFGFDIPVCVIGNSDLREAVEHAPAWWNNMPDAKHDAFFVIWPMTAAEICAHVGEAKEDYEKVAYHGRVIFWSAPIATFSRTRWSKLSKDKSMYNAVTVRNANTTLKLAELADTAHI